MWYRAIRNGRRILAHGIYYLARVLDMAEWGIRQVDRLRDAVEPEDESDA